MGINPKILKKYRLIILTALALVFSPTTKGQDVIDLAGGWNVQLEKNIELQLKYPSQSKLEGEIVLPASLAERGFGYKTKGSDFGILTPEFKYVGKAIYSREIIIPKNWQEKNIEIFLERVLWESRVLIDGIEVSKQDALGTPHIHQIGKLSPGSHNLMIQVDNDMIHNIGDKGHAYGEYTQSIWNGIVGRMEMRAYDPVRILSSKIISDISANEIEVKTAIKSEFSMSANINFHVTGLGEGKTIISIDKKLAVKKGIHEYSITIPAEKLQKWSEFTPVVYQLQSTLTSSDFSSEYETEFGFQEVSHDGTKILINGSPIFLRGNLDCVHFPLTGYASCDIEDWERIFKIYKEYGLNHARFHSWCPPEAAFKAANRVGIYLQAEASIWIDWWMSEDMTLKGRPEMDTKGHPKGLGFDPERDEFVIQEMNRVVDTYGNHPSFTMFCIGNELGNSNFDTMEKWVAELKEKDPRRLYAVSTARKITKVDDYSATHYIQGIGRARGLNGPHTDWDFEEVYDKMDIPVIAHEIGQWPVYPKWAEIDKYSGVLKARNFEEFKAVAEQNGIAEQDEDFAMASGALNQIMYKYETESFLRTASCAGVQLLSMQDYQGQGEALIGWLDAHWESKGITTPKKFREHFTTTVPLLRMEKMVWTNDEIFSGKAQISHHGATSIQGTCIWNTTKSTGEIVANGKFEKRHFPVGSLADLGDISFDLNQISDAEKLTISIEIENTKFRNEWDIWVYPNVALDYNGDILIADRIDENVVETLKAGGKVLLLANELGTETNAVKAHYYPLYWSLTFFPGQGKTCIGLLVDQDHPVFDNFPTSYHSDWQWESISNDAKGFILNTLPATYKPIAQPIDDFHRNNKVGSIFELKVDAGSLLVCGYNLNASLSVARQLKSSILKYMDSDEFHPQQSVDHTWIKQKFASLPVAESADISDELKGAILYIEAAKKLDKQQTSIPWGKKYDTIKIAEGSNYQIQADGVWKDARGAAWHGKEMKIQIDCPAGMLGSLYVHFHDWNKNDRKGILDFEGRKVELGSHTGDGLWIKFHVMREDSQDGKLVLKTTTTEGPNLMITKVILKKDI